MFRYKILFLMLISFSAISAETHTEGKFLGSKSTIMPNWFHQSFLDLSEDVKTSSKMNKNLLVFFHQDGCPYCNLLVKKNFSDVTTKAKLQQRFNVLAINMWGDREVINFNGNALTEKQFAVIHKVQFTPTLVFFNQKGEQKLRLNGYLALHEFNLALDFATLSGDLSFAEYKQQNLATKSTGSLIKDERFFTKPPFVLLQNNKSTPLAVFFETKNCVNCVKFYQKNLTDTATINLLKKLKVVQLDSNSTTKVVTPKGKKSTAKKWAEQLKVHFYPTIVFFDNQGQEIIRTEAMFKTFHFQSIVDYVQSGHYKTQPQFQRYLSSRADKIRASGKDVNIWK